MLRAPVRAATRAALALLVAGSVLGLSSVSAAATPLDPAGPVPAGGSGASHAVALFNGASVKGIAAFVMEKPGEGLTGSAIVAMYGVSPTARHALVLSRQPCGTPVVKASGYLKIEKIDGESISSAFRATREVPNLLPFLEQSNVLSVRLRRTTAPSRQIACANATLYADGSVTESAVAGAASAYKLQDTIISSYRRGIVLARPGAERVSLDYALLKLSPGKHRIVLSDAPCGQPIAGTVVASHLYFEDSVRTARFNRTATLKGDPLTVESIRLFKGGSGFTQPEGCSNIIGVLVAL